jgi:hypothetical protein
VQTVQFKYLAPSISAHDDAMWFSHDLYP